LFVSERATSAASVAPSSAQAPARARKDAARRPAPNVPAASRAAGDQFS